jgi:IclR family acetate operon transcriptional repressor
MNEVGAPERGGTRIRSVARAAQLLLWLAHQDRGATAKEIAEANRLGLPTTYHLLNTLADEGLLSKDADRRYVLGKSAAILAQAYLRDRAVPQSLLSAVHDLARTTGETAYLADWGEHDIRVRAVVEGRSIVRVAEVASGPYEHGHARANGKVLLAHAWPEVRQGYLEAHPPKRLTQTTICEPQELEAEFERIRRRGYAYDEEEFAVGVSCVAVPLLEDGRIIAAFGLAVPTERFQKNKRELTATLLEVVASIDAGRYETTAEAA